MAKHTAAGLLCLHLLLPIISVTDSSSNAQLSNSQPSSCEATPALLSRHAALRTARDEPCPSVS